MTDEIDIPASASEPKPWWTVRPNEQQRKEILSFILATGKPYLWQGQTYNKPPDDAVVDYLDEFRLPKSKLLVPCPCCRPRHPKYRHGMIAWFPNECVIRIIGHDCFKTINSERHTEALRKYHADRQRTADIAYLLDNLDKVPDLIAAVERAIPIADAVDKFRNDTCATFAEVLRTELWEHIRTGELRVARNRREFFQSPDQGEGEREVQIIETYGTIAGQNFLNRRSKKLGVKLDHAALALKQINFGSQYKERVPDMSDAERFQTARLLRNGMTTVDEVFAAIHELRQFTSAVTLATLNGWARTEGCPVRMHVEFERGNLYVGLTDHEFRPITAPPAYFDALPPVPSLAHKTAAA